MGNPELDRRNFLKAVGNTVASVALATTGLASITKATTNNDTLDDDLDKYDFLLTRVKFAAEKGVTDYWQAKPGGDANLLEELSQVVRCKVKPIRGTKNRQPSIASKGQFNAVVTFDEPERLSKLPFLFMTGESHYRFTDSQKENLKNYINRGGFLLMDDCMALGTGSDWFFQSSFLLLEDVFGKGAVKRIPNDHEIFHNVYDLGDIGLPFLNGIEHGAWGVSVGDRLAVLLSSHDIHCGWCDGKSQWFTGKPNQGPHGYKDAIRAGINIIMYALSH